MEKQYKNLLVVCDSPTAVVTMNRPERRNALSMGMMEEMIDCLGALGRSPDVRAVILAGAAPAFCAGHDLSELVGSNIGSNRQIFDTCTQLMSLIQEIPQPVIAEVNGIATAAGCQLVATCDLAVASAEASFATPGVRIGLFCTTPMVALTRSIGRKRALEMLLTGAAIDARRAMEWGLVNRVAPAAELRATTYQMAQQISQASPFTLSIGKQAFYAQIDMEQPKAYAYAKEVMTVNAMADDAQEGMSAFIEKRVPCWQGK